MTDINGLGSFSKITDLKEIANNKDMPILLKVSMFLNQLGLTKQAEAKTLIQDLDDTRNKATEYGNMINVLNAAKNRIKDDGALYLGESALSIDEISNGLKQLKKLKDIYNGTNKLEGISDAWKQTYISDIEEKVKKLAAHYGFNDTKSFMQEREKACDFLIDILETHKIYMSEGNKFKETITSSEITTLIDSLKSKRETLMSTVQEKMVVIQDVMGQYNTLVQGSSTTMNKYADLSKTLAQSMR